MEASAKLTMARLSPRKTRLVVDMIRGRGIQDALTILKFMPQPSAKLVAKLLNSAVANAEQKGASDVDRLFVSACYANQGPSQKRVRPAPMGRAFRVLKRTAHLTVRVSERPEQVVAIPADGAPAPKRARTTAAKKPAAKRAPAKKAKE